MKSSTVNAEFIHAVGSDLHACRAERADHMICRKLFNPNRSTTRFDRPTRLRL